MEIRNKVCSILRKKHFQLQCLISKLLLLNQLSDPLTYQFLAFSPVSALIPLIQRLQIPQIALTLSTTIYERGHCNLCKLVVKIIFETGNNLLSQRLILIKDYPQSRKREAKKWSSGKKDYISAWMKLLRKSLSVEIRRTSIDLEIAFVIRNVLQKSLSINLLYHRTQPSKQRINTRNTNKKVYK